MPTVRSGHPARPWAGEVEMQSREPDPVPDATDALFSLVYDELKRIARRHRRQAGTATLCTTELVHEAFVKLAQPDGASWEGRAHFFGAASRAMRQVLVDFARRRRAPKHGAGLRMVSLSEANVAIELDLDELLALDAALDRLDAFDERLRKIVELRFFGGLSEDDVARTLGLSARTVGRDWLKAKLFLLRELEPLRHQLG
jgi:RNA polymerase sigma factor (TIGR02999 family)